ncbi:MAG: hypothetical protein ACD_10C00867G0001 [uncultured bacterium]|nr:MAG: hypothetical protein ACD_10C00867G0001 [uncultured bacterium]
MVPMRFQELVDAIVTDSNLRHAIDNLLAMKRTVMESEYGQSRPIINIFIEVQLARLQSVAPQCPDDMDFSVLDKLLMDCVMQR